MADYDFVTHRLATGGALEGPADVQRLIKDGITHVVDLLAEQDDAPLFANQPTISYLWNPTADDLTHKDTIWFQKTIDFVLADIQDPKNKYYLHCMLGHNRGPSSTYAILRSLGLSPTLSEALIRTARPEVTLAYIHDADQAIAELGY